VKKTNGKVKAEGDRREHDVGSEEKRMGRQTTVIDRRLYERDCGRRK
jgi:hypothetical protein